MPKQRASNADRQPGAGPNGLEVDRFLADLEHPCKNVIEALRRLILSVDPAIGEAIQWNAPSFHTTQHFATMHLRAKQGIALILHFGAKKNDISTTGVAIRSPGSAEMAGQGSRPGDFP